MIMWEFSYVFRGMEWSWHASKHIKLHVFHLRKIIVQFLGVSIPSWKVVRVLMEELWLCPIFFFINTKTHDEKGVKI